MAVAPASMADSIVILDDDDDDGEEQESSKPTSSACSTSARHRTSHVSPLKANESAPTHITQSPFASARRDSHVLQAENQRLFTEFVQYCSTVTHDSPEGPEVLTFLRTKHSKASPEFLSSAEFRNTLGRCLTRVQANRAKTYVYINELCTVLRQHAAKRRVSLAAGSAAPPPPPAPPPAATPQREGGAGAEGEARRGRREDGTVLDDEQPSTSGLPEDRAERSAAGEEEEKKAKRASRKQIAYLENLLKVYNDEIHRLQERELCLDDMEKEDSGYIQEHKLKRKMMKIYARLCELKGCNTYTGRVIEQRIPYKGTRYPEINRKIERYINRPEAQQNPPDYPDVLKWVLRANERHSLCLSRKHLNQMAQEAFQETGKLLQERRHLDLVYNFGSHLTDAYKPASDPALVDPSLMRRLRSNREVALSSLEEVISKYAVQQDDVLEQERSRQRARQGKEEQKPKPQEDTAKGNNEEEEEEEVVAEEEEEEEEEEDDDLSSDPDIEEEIQASEQQAGPDDDADDDEEEDGNEAEQANGDGGEQGGGGVGDEEPVIGGLSPLSTSLSVDDPSPRDSPSQSEPVEPQQGKPAASGDLAAKDEAVGSSNHVQPAPVSTREFSQDTADLSPAAANQASAPPSPLPSPRVTRKRKREEMETGRSHRIGQTIINDSEADITLDMGMVVCSLPPQAVSTRDSPTQDLVTSSRSTPPPKKNKVNKATQCDPDEIIVLSDSE